MRKQYAVLGLSRFGESVATTLQSMGCDVVVVDKNEEKVQAVADKVASAMIADTSNPEVLRTIGAEQLDGVVVATTSNLEASVLATMTASEMQVPYVLAVARNETHAKLLKKVGATNILFPEQEMGVRIANSIVSTDFSDWISLSDDYSLIEIETPAVWVGKSLKALNVRKNFNVNIVAITDGEDVEVNIDPDEPFAVDKNLIIVGANEDLERVKNL